MSIKIQKEIFGNARWISDVSDYFVNHMSTPVTPSPYLRRDFLLTKDVKSAVVKICGLGLYELYINNKKANDVVLAPLFTAYNKRMIYDAIPITENLVKGTNCIGVVLGNGWYMQPSAPEWEYQTAPWKSTPKVILNLVIEYTDGTFEEIISDSSFKTINSGIIYNSLRNGEYYDARADIEGWADPETSTQLWNDVLIVRPPGGIMQETKSPPIREHQTIPLIKIGEYDGKALYDAQQNITGYVQFSGRASSGDTIIFKYSEILGDNGKIDTEAIGYTVTVGEFQTDKYTFGNHPAKDWSPRFVYHGFRYVEVEHGGIEIDGLSAVVVHSDLKHTGHFSCSSPLFNRIQTTVLRTNLGNFFGFPTDCPTREKNGWTGDAQVACEQMLFNFDMKDAYAKWLEDFKDAQQLSGQLSCVIPGVGYDWGNGPAWDSAIIIIPWYVYVYTGDDSVIRSLYDNIKLYMEYMDTMAIDGIVEYGLGDWCVVELDDMAPVALTDTGYYYSNAIIVTKMARLIGDEETAQHYEKTAELIKEAFNKKFVNPDTGEIENHTQTAYAAALYHNLLDANTKVMALKHLKKRILAKDGHTECGILGVKYLLSVLPEDGMMDLMYEMASKTTYPSWGYMLEQGATTIWETWKGEHSHNHPMFGTISEWFYKYVAGIQPMEEYPGFKKIMFAPKFVDGLDFAEASLQTKFGRVSIRWERNNSTVQVELEIPPGATGIYTKGSELIAYDSGTWKFEYMLGGMKA